MIKRIMTTCAVAAAFACSAMAQTLKIAGSLHGNVPADMKLYVMPVADAMSSPDSIAVVGGKLSCATKVSQYGIYKLVGVLNRRQLIVPFHAACKAGADARLDISLTEDGNIELVGADADTKSLVAFNDLTTERNKRMWMEGKTMAADSLKALVLGYPASADSMINVYHPSPMTSRYLRLWASTTSFENMESLKFATGRDLTSLAIDLKAEATRMLPSIDCKMSSAFDAAPRILLATIPQGGLAQRVAAVESAVKNVDLRRRAQDVLLDRYVTRFNYSNNYEEGLKQLTDLTARFNLDSKYVQGAQVVNSRHTFPIKCKSLRLEREQGRFL